MRVKNYFQLMFYWKDLALLDYFDALGLNVCKLSFGGFSFEKFILMEDVGLMTFCYLLEGFMSFGDFDFITLV